MPNLLTKLHLEELSVVDDPANPLAMAPLFKRKEPKMEDKDQEQLEKLKKDNESLRKALIDNGFKITAEGIQKREPEDFVEFKGEKITKSDDRYELVMEIKKRDEEKAEAELVQKASKELPNMDPKVAVEFLKSEPSEEAMKALKAADEALGMAMTEKGSADVDGAMSDPQTKLDAEVEKIKTEDGVSKEKALEKLAKTSDGRKLINEAYYKKEK